MALSEYTGATPQSEPGLVVGRVARHHRWTMGSVETATCPHCEASLDLHERHLLVTLSEGPASRPAGRRYLCDETCLQRWLGGE